MIFFSPVKKHPRLIRLSQDNAIFTLAQLGSTSTNGLVRFSRLGIMLQWSMDLLGVIGGEEHVFHSSIGNCSTGRTSTSSLMPIGVPSRPENIGLRGVASMSQLPGLPITLPAADSGGV